MTDVSNGQPPLRFSGAELKRRLDAENVSKGIDGDAEQQRLVEAGLRRFSTYDGTGTRVVTADAFERFSELRRKYEVRLDAALSKYAQAHPVKYVLGNLALKFVDRGEEFRREVAHFDYADFASFLDKQGIAASMESAEPVPYVKSEIGDNP
jgi:hypothetical protein